MRTKKEVLDIGASYNPIPEATVAADLFYPNIPRGARRPVIIKSPSAQPSLGLPGKFWMGHNIKEYFVGNAAHLPDSWEGRFDKVYADSSVGVDSSISGPKMGIEISRVLKPGGAVNIISNAAPTMRLVESPKSAWIRASKDQEKRLVKMLKAGNLVGIKTIVDYPNGNVRITAKKRNSIVIKTANKPVSKYRLIRKPVKKLIRKKLSSGLREIRGRK